MFKLFRRNCLYNDAIEPHCAYCAHCKPENEYQGVCTYRGIVAMAGSCRRFSYDALRRRPPRPARIRGRFTDADFFFEEKEDDVRASVPAGERADAKPLIADGLSQYADLWEDDETEPAADAAETENAAGSADTGEAPEPTGAENKEETHDDADKV